MMQGKSLIGAVNAQVLTAAIAPESRPWIKLGEALGSVGTACAGQVKSEVQITALGQSLKNAAGYLSAAVVVGLLKDSSKNAVNLVNALHLAKEAGVTIASHQSDAAPMLAQSACEVEICANGVSHKVVGSVQGDVPVLLELNGGLFRQPVPLTGNLIFFKALANPQLVPSVAGVLAAAGLQMESFSTSAAIAGEQWCSVGVSSLLGDLNTLKVHVKEALQLSLTGNIEALDTVWVYNGDTDEWTEGCPMLHARYYHCSVTLHGCVYVIGGYRGGAPAPEAEFYDPLKKTWSPVANMVQGVGNATACVLRDIIYVTGGHYGYRGSCTYDKIQRYRSDLNEWSIVTISPHPGVGNATACVLRDIIYVTGGHYGYRGSCTYDKIQRYRSDLNEWSIVTISPHPEYGLCSVALNNKLHLVGGQTTITDCYDPEKDEWRQMAPMMERRMECGAVAMNGCIYVTGGYSYSKGTYLQSIEKYDPKQDKWEIVGKLLSAMRSHGCVCVYSV
ncbi:UNVERIFIED_CONTAM: hypothetical protein FKN15_057838 [Acipenser sinensis]